MLQRGAISSTIEVVDLTIEEVYLTIEEVDLTLEVVDLTIEEVDLTIEVVDSMSMTHHVGLLAVLPTENGGGFGFYVPNLRKRL